MPCPPTSFEFVDTTAALARIVDALSGAVTSPPSLYVDLEGEYLGRLGTISIIQIYLSSRQQTYLIDVQTLGAASFSEPGTNGTTLKTILESASITKVFFDVRNDSNALFSHFNIDLKGVEDLQLMELASRKSNKRLLYGLKKCIESDAPMTPGELLEWGRVKQQGLKLFSPDSGGSYAVFSQRPLPRDILSYCVQDVQYLPRLWKTYNEKLTPAWKLKVLQASQHRVIQSQAADYNGKGRHMAMAPKDWIS
ncbi:hypothetical protein GCG54_00009994 [Colletotrichum gloeosporioides]|uniref:3'-5' exonuclease domain-containing protein n=1 Tax=Colletotrichum gloeosporioides TaxID=474922 RepID=A0A8H4FFA9_COLGL|nr:uncharacterized protein GCG54_00009994 [Colletotrichum gloeosporioides]KAF3799805.1 hypothetical protein GCG54_00009994 [Colletotrichum gloeosporioides]